MIDCIEENGRILRVGDEVQWKFKEGESDEGCYMLKNVWYKVERISSTSIFIITSAKGPVYMKLIDDIVIKGEKNKQQKIDYLAITKDIVG